MNKRLETKKSPRGGSILHQPFALKSLSDEGIFTGYAAKFGNVDFGGDMIIPGAFKEFLGGAGAQKVKGLWQHDWDHPIFVPTLMKEDENGLYVEAKLVLEVQKAREALALAKAGALGGMSIGYVAKDWSYENDVRLLKKIDLKEFSLVTFPMNDQATITSAKADGLDNELAEVKTLADCEAFLRDAGQFSRTEAKAVIAKVKDVLRGDAGGQSEDTEGKLALSFALANLNSNIR